MDLNSVNTQNSKAAIKGVIYSGALRALMEPELIGMNYVDMITDFTEGDLYREVEMGNANYREYKEGDQVVYDAFEFGQRDFEINHYATSGHIVTAKFYQDSGYAAQIAAAVPGKEARALSAKIEKEIFQLHRVIQKAGEANAVETMSHRYVAGHDADAANIALGTITPHDFAYAAVAMAKAGYFGPKIAIIPTYQALLIPQAKGASEQLKYNPMWADVVTKGSLTGMTFAFNLAGFDIYTSNFTDVIPSETLSTAGGQSKECTKCGVAQLFINNAGERPYRMAWRQMPSFKGWFDDDHQVEKYLTVCRYGLGAGEKGNLISILCKTDANSQIA
jgi:hypothetical protein